MQRITTNRATIAPAFILATVPLALLAAIRFYQIFGNIPAARSAREDTQNAFFVIRAASALSGAIEDAERSQRGYLITGREVYLTPYETAKEHIPELVRNLQQAIVDRPAQQRPLLTLQADLTTKMNELAATIAARREKGFDAALAIVNTDAGRTAMEAIQADIDAITDAANAGMLKQMAISDAVDQRAMLAFIIGSVIGALALLCGGILLARAHRRAAMSERMLLATLDSVREGVAAFDADRRLLAWNQTFSRMLKLPRETLRMCEVIPRPDIRNRPN